MAFEDILIGVLTSLVPIAVFLFSYVLRVEHRLTRLETKLDILLQEKIERNASK